MEKDLIKLRHFEFSDLDVFFNHQCEIDGIYMAGFTSENPNDKKSFLAKWDKILADKDIFMRTIQFGSEIAGHLAIHSWFGDPELTYWIGNKFWGKGITSEALNQFLKLSDVRPLFARVIFDNIASIKVLERNGFKKIGEDKGFANARNSEVIEYIYKLD